MRKALLLSAVLFAGAVGPASAQPAPRPPAPGETVLNLSATEHEEVQQDTLVASLNIEKQGPDARALQNQINKMMQQAVAQAKAVQGVQVSTEQYYIYPVDPDPNAKPPVKRARFWRGSQTLQLKSKQADGLLPLVGSLQDLGMSVQNLSYMLSPEAAEDAKDTLLERALMKVKSKAERTAKVLDKGHVELSEINVDTANGEQPPRPMMMRAMSMEAAAPKMEAPSAEAGTSTIDLTVTVKAILKP